MKESERADEIVDRVPFGMRVAAAWSWRLLLVGAAIAVALFLIVQLRLVVIPIMVALLISALLVPFAGFLQRHGCPRWLSIAAAMLSMIIVISGLLTLGISQIVRGSGDLAAQSVVAWKELAAWLHNGPLQLNDSQLTTWTTQILQTIQKDMGAIWTGALSIGSTVGHFIAGMFLVLFATLFMLIDGRGIWRWVVGIFPKRARTAVDTAGRNGWATLESFVKVQILVATIDALGIGLGAFFLGVPLAVPIGILVFLGSFIPIVGALVTGALAVFVALVYNGWVIALVMLAVILVVQQVEGHVLQPLIMGTAVKVHPLGVVLAVATGSLLAGIPGALFAVPVAACANVMVNTVAQGEWKQEQPIAVIRNPLWRTVPRRPSGGRRLRARRRGSS